MNPDQDPAAGDGSKPPKTGIDRWKDLSDIVAKLMAPVFVFGGGALGYNYQQSMQTSQLLAQREQSDTQIRAEMFKAITEKLLGTHQPQEQAVFSQLLVLNFHEHIELKPLMEKVDRDLMDPQKWQGAAPAQIEGLRNDLSSVARRVRDRQVAQLVLDDKADSLPASEPLTWVTKLLPAARAATAGDRRSDRGRLRYVSVSFPDANSRYAGAAELCQVPDGEGHNIMANEPMFDRSPDGQDSISITVSATAANWRSRKFLLTVKPQGSLRDAPEPSASAVGKSDLSSDDQSGARAFSASSGSRFEVSDFDLPLTDNTRLASGARYAVFLENVCPEKMAIKLGVLWFPDDYYPAHERPTNRRQIANLLGVSRQP